MADSILRLMRTLNRGVAYLVGIMLLACAAFVLADILLRQVGASFGGTDEISGYVMAIATAWGMGFALMELSHVRIDLLRQKANALGRSLFDIFSMIVLTAVVLVIAYQCWPVLERSITNSSTANTPLETPLVWVQGPWLAGWIWFAIVSTVTTLCALTLILQGRFGDSEQAIGAFGEADNL
ncbi:MAG: TRAP transporter small permease [Loktanella sp.]|nr:TRAP transporter small permease [Loktanella sp.]